MQNNPKPYQIYQHRKGNLYQVLNLAKNEEDGEMMVVYQGLYSPYQVWVRPLKSFMETVDSEHRFTLQENAVTESVNQIHEQASSEIRQEEKEDEIVMEPLVLEFLEADTYEERLNILAAVHHKVTDDMINTMAIALDVEIAEGDTEDRFLQLRNCLLTFEKYEGRRVR